MYLTVKKVIPKDDYKLLLTFENGEERQFDMKPYLDTGVFKKLKNINIFNTVGINFDTIEWQGGIDFSPEVLYQESIKLSS